ncbi:Crp/Fnr family transcriptional regulator [Acidisarcina polymorpha]
MEVEIATARPELPLSAFQPNEWESVPAFTPILAEDPKFLARLPAARLTKAGSLLLEQGSAIKAIYLLQCGLVKLSHLTPKGCEGTIGLRSAGWYVGAVASLLSARPVYTVRTVTDCMAVRIPTALFSRLLRESPEMAQHLLEILCIEVASQASFQIEMACYSAEERLHHFMSERERVLPLGKSLAPLPMLKQLEVGQLLSITPEYLNRLLHKRKLLKALRPQKSYVKLV